MTDITREAEGDWIEWHGGECPVPLNSAHQTKHRDGFISPERSCDVFASDGPIWAHSKITPQWDIIAYRVVPA